MNWKRYLKGTLRLSYSHWQGWKHLSFNRYWSGRILCLNVSKWTVTLDCRENWLADMVTCKPT